MARAFRDSDGRLLTTQRQFRCRCDRCKAVRPPIYDLPPPKGRKPLRWIGKLWQAGYFEPQAEFKARVLAWHASAASPGP